MNITAPLSLLGGLSPQQFMQGHWGRKPLLIRQAMNNFKPLLPRAALFALAAQDDVESRLIVQRAENWHLRHGPLTRRALPALAQPHWTLLVQGLDLHVPAAHALLQQFCFLPHVRLDDLMVSYASDGGGVGAHYDSYDVFLLQAQGRRRWRIGRPRRFELRDDVPLKVLKNFQAEQEFVLDAGDMLYLPPNWAHEGVAEGGDCMTYSIGFRAPNQAELAHELLQRMGDHGGDKARLYQDAGSPASEAPGELPMELLAFAQTAVDAACAAPDALLLALGEYLTEPKAQVVFEAAGEDADAVDLKNMGSGQTLALHPATRMVWHGKHLFINGESLQAKGRDLRLMQQLANARHVDAKDLQTASGEALQAFAQWLQDGWLRLEFR
jgi:50S ribosomal protein L16 3-hydroxylase